MRYFVTGGAGFIGSHLVDRLMADGHEVTVYDNLSTGDRGFVEHHLDNPKFKLIEADLLDFDKLCESIRNHDFVFHIAANADVRGGVSDTKIDLDQGLMATYNVLEAMRRNSINKIAYSSSSTVYGEATVIPTPEDYGPMVPISFYGASKLGCEAFISAFAESFNMQAWIFRFANIIGSRSTHGIILDFINKLRKNPGELEILGDGTQKKSYLLVGETVDAIMFVINNAKEPVNIYNLGCDSQISVKRIAEIIVEKMGAKEATLRYTGGGRGWVGDVPQMLLSVDRLNRLGWKSKHSSEEAISIAVDGVLND